MDSLPLDHQRSPMNSFLKGEFISDLYFFLKNEVCLYAVSVSLCPETFQRENVLQGFAQGSDMVPCINTTGNCPVDGGEAHSERIREAS